MSIQEQLVKLAPNIEFSVSWSPDFSERWNEKDWGKKGERECFNADVSAKAIVRGKLIEGNGYLGGCWEIPGDFDPDIGGYLPQKLEEAAEELLGALADQGGDASIAAQLLEALGFLKKEMQERYDKQMKGRKK
jgi:hypothetical protein